MYWNSDTLVKYIYIYELESGFLCCQTPGAGTQVFCRWAPSIFLSCQKQQPQRNAERNHCNVWNVKAGEKNSVKTVECVVTQCFTTVQVSSPECTSAVIPCFFLPVKSKLVVHCRALIYEIPVSACHPPTSRRMNISEQLWWCHQYTFTYTIQYNEGFLTTILIQFEGKNILVCFHFVVLFIEI